MNDTLDGLQQFDEDLDAPFMKQQVLASAVRRRSPISTPSSGLESPRPQPGANPNAPMQAGDYRDRAFALLKQASDSTPDQTDVNALREYAKIREENANRQLLTGLALSMKGGETLQPLGEHMLKNALATNAPEKFGGGLLAGGQFIADPEVNAQRRAVRLETQARLYEAMASHAETIEQRRAAAEAAAALRRDLADMNAGRAGQRADQTQANRAFQQENALRDDFEKQVKDQRISIGTYPQIEAALTSAPSAGSDMRAIFRYMKMLDPTSVVREGEFATARNATGIPSQVLNLYNRALEGTMLTPQQRADFLGQARSERDTALKFFNERAAEFGSRAQGYGLNPRNVILGYDGGGAGPAPSGGATPPGVSVRRKE